MTTSTQWRAHWITGFVALVCDLAWMVLSPFYEKGASVFVTPLLCLLGVAFFFQYLRKNPWAYRYSPHYAIGTGAVMAQFIGSSSEFYGRYALAMSIVEA